MVLITVNFDKIIYICQYYRIIFLTKLELYLPILIIVYTIINFFFIYSQIITDDLIVYMVGGEGEGSSNLGGENDPGHSPNPQNNNNLPPVNPGDSGLPRDESSNTLGSNVSYTSSDVDNYVSSQVVNIKNTLEDPNLTTSQKTEEVMKQVAEMADDLREAKKEIKNFKQSGQIPIIFNNK